MGANRLDIPEGNIYHEEGVMATRSSEGFCIHVPSPLSFNHEFAIAGALWEVWVAIRSQVVNLNHECVVDVSVLNELPLPLISILFEMDVHLNQVGRHLRVVGKRREIAQAAGGD